VIRNGYHKVFQKVKGWCMLGDCRKSPKMAILAILRAIKSITYMRQIHRFRVDTTGFEKYNFPKETMMYHNFMVIRLDTTAIPRTQDRWSR
jgi:hypothetical protein